MPPFTRPAAPTTPTLADRLGALQEELGGLGLRLRAALAQAVSRAAADAVRQALRALLEVPQERYPRPDEQPWGGHARTPGWPEPQRADFTEYGDGMGESWDDPDMPSPPDDPFDGPEDEEGPPPDAPAQAAPRP